jgi:hypothetical protein
LLLLNHAACGGRTELWLDGPTERGVADGSVADVASGGPDAAASEPTGTPDDAGAPDAPDALPDAYASPAVAPCLGNTLVLYVSGDPGNGFFEGSGSIAGAQAMWTSEYSTGQSAAVSAGSPRYAWGVTLGVPIGSSASLVPGEYDAAPTPGTSAWVDLAAKGVSCGQATGSFDVLVLDVPPGDQVTITRLLASFDVHCAGGAPDAMVHGCVRYEP